MAARNRKNFKRQQNNSGAADLSVSKEDLVTSIRKLEAQLAQENFFHEKSKAEQQQEIKVLNGKVKNLERQKKALLVKLEKNPFEQLNMLQRELNETKKKLEEANQKIANFNKQMEKLSRSNREIKKAKEKVAEEFLEKIQKKNSKIHKLEEKIRELKTTNFDAQVQESPPAESNSLKLSNTMKSENWDAEIYQEEEKEQKVTSENFEKTQTESLETCAVNFFPSIYNAATKNKEGRDSSQQAHQGNEMASMNYSASSCASLEEQPASPCDKNILKNKDEDVAQDSDKNSDALMTTNRNEHRKINCAEDHIFSTISCTSQQERAANYECSYMKRLRNLYTKMGLGSKANAAEDIAGACLQVPVEYLKMMTACERPPPGFHADDTGFTPGTSFSNNVMYFVPSQTVNNFH
ncbi:spindle pole body component 110-like [Stylophora pistillata]|uniref:Uncharacterized protein n=1 Tax=Stylophora pistillata TaxID=50429 RepID=A0A2B4T053_STYPI|nr:spindle pole body component 110-like [Stylophora pistillata]PFX34015.1 hypothetical protein AWC38_SpisGene1186 [Stylophora pistillata]